MDYRLPNGDTVSQRLLTLQKSGNKPFTKSLHPGIENILGLRVPDVRALAKEIAGSNYPDYLARPGEFYMEERMLHGMVLGQIKITDTEEYLRMVDRFVGCINSWSVCDTFKFAGGQKFITRNSERLKEFLTAYLSDDREYAVRFGVVMLMSYFITPQSAPSIMSLLETVTHPGYYAHMALAWAVAEAYIKAPDAILPRLATSPLPVQTINKAISKINDSYRLSPDRKAAAKALRRKV